MMKTHMASWNVFPETSSARPPPPNGCRFCLSSGNLLKFAIENGPFIVELPPIISMVILQFAKLFAYQRGR